MIHRGSVHIWRIRLDATATLSAVKRTERIDSWRRILSIQEQLRADAFQAQGHGQDYITAHAALRFVLGMYLGVLPTSVSIHALEGAKPTLAPAGDEIFNLLDSGRDGYLDLRFNLSHTRDTALIGVVVGRELGVDIEWQRPMEDLDGMARAVMSDRELDIWKALDREERTQAFYQVWTRKESYLKAIGLGLYRNLQDVTVPVSSNVPDDSPDNSRLIVDRAGEGKWSVWDISVWKGYSASVCWEGEDIPHLIVRDLDIVECDLSVIGELIDPVDA